MLTSFFSKSKPLNLAVIIILLSGFYISANFILWKEGFTLAFVLQKIAIMVVLIFSVLVLNFIAKKNELTKRSAYKTLLFAVFAASFIDLLRSESVIIANLCVLFALRRVISLRSMKFVQKKIFDATFWISIATLYHFWTSLFFIIIFIAILNFASYSKNYLVPFVAFFAVAILTNCYHLLVNNDFYLFNHWYQSSNFDFSKYGDIQLLIPLSVILGVLIWTLFHYFSTIEKASINRRPTLSLVLLSLLAAIGVAVFSPTKNGSELIFFFVPLSIIASNYFERKKDRIFKEILLACLILMPIVVLIFS